MSAPNRDLIERARQADILAVAQRYGAKLRRVGGGEFVGPCPVCGGSDRFSVNTRKHVWNCRGCGKGGDAITLVQHVINSTFAEAVATLAGEQWAPTIPPSHRRHDDADNGVRNNGSLASRIWRSAGSIKGTLAEHYLVRVRGIDIEQIPNINECLRFVANCPFDGDELPCLIALVRDVVTDAPMGIVRTALDQTGQKISRRALGPKKGGAIKLWPDTVVSTGLVVGEGLETVAGAATHIEHRGTRLQPAWAVIDRINLRDFPALPGVEALTILVDNDQSGDGQEAADVCTRRWIAAGRHVEQLIPRIVGTDFNNIVMGSAVR